MLRQLLARYRNSPRSLTSSLIRSSQPQQGSSWQRHFLTRSEMPRRGPRTNQYRHNGNRQRQLRAGMHTTIYVSITALILDEALDAETRRSLAIRTVQHITGEEDPEEKWRKFYQTGTTLLAIYSDSDLDYHEDIISVPTELGCLDAKIFTAPDPEVEGGTVLLCLAVVNSGGEDTYLSENGNRLTDIAMAIAPEIEEFASTLETSPRVRGAMLILDQDGNWKNLYWDSKRWINIIYLEWQTAETMGFA